jgi:hypothetical protein
MAVFWDVTPCSLVEMTDVSEVLTFSIIIALLMEAVSTSETSVTFYHSTRCNISEDSYLHSLQLTEFKPLPFFRFTFYESLGNIFKFIYMLLGFMR